MFEARAGRERGRTATHDPTLGESLEAEPRSPRPLEDPAGRVGLRHRSGPDPSPGQSTPIAEPATARESERDQLTDEPGDGLHKKCIRLR